MKEKRLYGIDLIKTLAIFFVIFSHFLLHSGYYETIMIGNTMFFSTLLRWLFFTCVPLFILSTGFLRYKKTVSKKYYFSLIPIYISCVLAGIISVTLNNESPGIFFDILSVISLKNGYLWYMEMFLGVALLIPFINISYNNMKKSHKHILIIILLFLTAIFSLDLKLTRNNHTYYLFSNYWVILYPFTYYLIGAYINEYRPKINKSLGVLLLILTVGFEGIYTYLRCKNQFFNWELLGGYGGITVLISSILIFLILYDNEIKNKAIRVIIKDISSKTLDIYMISYVFDFLIYNKIRPFLGGNFENFTVYALFIVIFVFLLSYIYSTVKKLIFDLVTRKKQIKTEATVK